MLFGSRPPSRHNLFIRLSSPLIGCFYRLVALTVGGAERGLVSGTLATVPTGAISLRSALTPLSFSDSTSSSPLPTSEDFTVLLWPLAQLIDLESGAELSPACVLRGHADAVTCCAFSPDGQRLLTGSKDK
ncbi:hypothetical protein chiPu_0032854, partial [Chiloscyllium punctatum]|nr:hypothetical protein [Chiloscyllium punctatum]